MEKKKMFTKLGKIFLISALVAFLSGHSILLCPRRRKALSSSGSIQNSQE